MVDRSGTFDVRLIWAAVAFAIAAACFLGLVLNQDLTGRLLFGTTWSAVGTWWLGRYLDASKPPD